MESGECGNLLATATEDYCGRLAESEAGGILIYSTSTYNTKEDEENVRWIQQEFGAESMAVDIREEWNITGNLLCGESASVYHFFPHKTKGEGFFLSVLRKPETAGEDSYADIIRFRKENPPEKKVRKVGEPLLRLSPRKTWQRPENG